jgi:hypothetical protein
LVQQQHEREHAARADRDPAHAPHPPKINELDAFLE